MQLGLADDGFVNETIEIGTAGGSAKRIHRTAEEKRRIVEATLLPGASIARVARERGVNANQVFQWRYEYRNGASWAATRSRAELLPVTLVTEPSSAIVPEITAPASPSGSIHIELPGHAVVNIESGVDTALVRAVLESLLR
jgi:transposase